jgi:hypothetical protein
MPRYVYFIISKKKKKIAKAEQTKTKIGRRKKQVGQKG